MSIHFISGKPGGGKTLYSVKMIVDELVYGDRCVITNVPLNLGELNAYLQKRFPNKAINLHERVRLFDEDEMRGFFCIRPHGSRGPELLSKEAWAKGNTPDYSGITDKGVAYFVDEVHIGFNARAWMDTGKDVLYYLSQHRKLGDTVVCITQAIMNVDKQFRSVTQDYTYMRNLSKEKLSKFRLPSVFIRQTYMSPASDNSKPMETGSFRLDVGGLAKCYDTARGVGIHGRAGADTGERKTGMPWWVAVLAIIALVYVVAFWVPGLVAKAFDRDPHRGTKKPIPVQANTNVVSATEQSFHVETNVPPLVVFVATNEPPPLPKVEAVTKLGGRYQVYLSNGDYYRQGDAELEAIGHTFVQISGKRHTYARPEVGEKIRPLAEVAYAPPPAAIPVTISNYVARP